MGNNILSIKNLSFSYNGSKVLNNISFDIGKGSFISILGPNGSGKSTIVNLITGVLEGYKGKIVIDGKDIKNLSSREIAKITAVVPQYTNPGFSFTVEELVMMGRHPYISRFGGERKEDIKIVGEVMKKTKITQFLNRKFDELSGGEKQRVVIAQALAQNSPVLILDEPTSHLDMSFQIELMELFLMLNKEENKTIIGIFHDINLAIQYSNKIMFLKEGEIFSFGDISSTITRDNIKNVFSSDVFVGRNPFTGKLYISPAFSTYYGKSSSENKKNKNIRIHVIGGGGAASPVLNMLYGIGYSVSCGVINSLDTDLETSEMLGISYVLEAPFSPISLDSQHKNLKFIKSSNIVILADIEFGHGNFSNLVAVKEAIDIGKKVIVINRRNIEKRDHTEGKAKNLYRRIIEKGALPVSSIDELPAIIDELVRFYN